MPAARIPLAFHVGPGGCWNCYSHAPNADGYIRLRQGKGHEFLHRIVWRLQNGDIPEGWEIDHLCGSRACSNPLHLRCIPRSTHLDHTNRTRYSDRKSEARATWNLNRRITGTELADRFGVSFSQACRWIREWKTYEPDH